MIFCFGISVAVLPDEGYDGGEGERKARRPRETRGRKHKTIKAEMENRGEGGGEQRRVGEHSTVFCSMKDMMVAK